MTKPVKSPQTTLILNTTNRDQTDIALIMPDQTKKLVKDVRAQDVQQLVDQLLLENDRTIDDLDAVGVLVGPGSYTGTRIGVAAANTLAWLLKKPVFEFDGDSLDDAISQFKTKQLRSVPHATARY